MNAMNGGAVAMATSPNGFLHAGHMRPQPIPASALRHRVPDGSYPFRAHRSVADIWAAGQ
jgi:hypothetical protein